MEHTQARTRAAKRSKKADSAPKTASISTPKMPPVTPLTRTQTVFFDTYDKYQVISLTGCPGTGKTFLALYKALEQQRVQSKDYTHIKVIRSSVSGRDIGFMPGNAKEKMSVFEAPYIGLINDLYDCGTAYESLKAKHIVEFTSTSFLRGMTFNDCIVIVDEAQNCSYQELYTILTRVGKNCKVIITGDINQDDLTNPRYKETSGYREILKILDKISSCKKITFGIDDIVRSGFVRDFIIASQPEAETPNNTTVLMESLERRVGQY